MDGVILAGGRGGRLNGVAATWLKPLLPIDGVPLITRAVDAAWEFCSRVAVVVAPQNAGAISDVLGPREVTLIVQREPRGPGDALLVGLQVVRSEHALVLLADNVLGPRDVAQLVERRGVGVRRLPPEQSERFTRFDHVHNRWVEKVPVEANQIDSSNLVTCWVGPLVVDSEKAHDVLLGCSGVPGELLLGPYLSEICADVRTPVEARDVGTVETYVGGAL